MSKRLSNKIELARKAVHILSNTIIAISFVYLDYSFFITSLVIISSILLIVDILRFKSIFVQKMYNKFFGFMTRHKERALLTGATYSLLSASLVCVIFTDEIIISTLLITGFSDSSAAIFGKYFGKTTINKHKTLEGSLAFIFSGLIIISLFCHSFFIGLLSLILSCIVEIYSPRFFDDNFTVPLSFSLSYYIGLLIWIS